MIKRIFQIGFILLLTFVGILLFNTFRSETKQIDVQAEASPTLTQEAIARFTKAVQIRTISYGDSILPDSTEFYKFHRFLKESYPVAHEKLDYETVADYSLLYKWQGKNSSTKPIVLMAHMDVVPVEPGTEDMWSVDPFGGLVQNDTIWGRGTTDDKMNLIAIMESVEKLLKEGFVPERAIYLSFGHDEEIGGDGAIAIAALLKSRGVEAEMVLDEGGIITEDKIPGISKPMALIGTAEKGYMSLDLSVEESGGHSSMPAAETSIDILAKAIVRLRENPFDASFSQSTIDFINYIGPEQAFFQKMIFANQWLFNGTIEGIYEQSAGGNAMVRTTIAPTIIHAGIKDNVIPTLAKATINFRLLPGDTKEFVTNRVSSIIADERISISQNGFGNNPSKVTPVNGFGFKAVEKAIRMSFEGVIVAPFLMIGATDSRHFGEVSSQIIKFSPMSDPIGFHGIDERLSIKGYQDGIWFFEQLIKNME